MLIDKQGKLFGKINVIDLIVIVILAATVCVLGLRFLAPKSGSVGETLEIKYYVEEVNDWVADKIEIGDELYDGTSAQEIGTVTAIEKGAPVAWAVTEDGRYVPAQREGFCSLIITGEVQGEKTETGAEIGGNMYGVGHSMVLYAGDAKIYLRVYDIGVKTA